MPAPTVAQIREGIATNLGTISGTQVSAYMLASPTPPYIEVFPEEVAYDAAHRRGQDTWRITVRAFVGLTTDEGSQYSLDEMLNPSGARSIKAAVESDRTLGGTVSDLIVRSATGYRVYERPGSPPVLGCEWFVEVLALGA